MSRTDKSRKEKKVKLPSRFLNATFFCGSCEKNVHVDNENGNIHFSASDSECEMCGSHGHVSVEFTCSECNKSITIELSSW